MRKPLLWLLLVSVTCGTAAYCLHRFRSDDRGMFLPGTTSHGHYQIELACNACHTPFEGVKQDACLECHAEELKSANDSHPRSKFVDPRNVHHVERIEARQCVTCHKEHVPEITRPMAVTVPPDVCSHCHADIGRERPSHREFAFTTCSTAGCHNYHDNTPLYEDFLLKHRGEPAVKAPAAVARRNMAELLAPKGVRALTAGDQDAPPGVPADGAILNEWSATAHARAGVNCRACHEVRERPTAEPRWMNRPGPQACVECHGDEVKGFLAGHHGMRLAQGLSPMKPGMARLPMKAEARDRELNCASCHGAHGFNTRRAAVEGCLACHDDAHSRAYVDSPHHALWRAEVGGRGEPGTGVSCATCHLPRGIHRRAGQDRVIVQHNQNDNLRPVSKMIRSACIDCHGLAFAIDALADRELGRANYRGKPSHHVESVDMADRRKRDNEKSGK